MRYTFPLLILLFIITTSCDDESFRWDSDPAEVRINWLNQSEIEAEYAIGDSIQLELALEFFNMPSMYSVDFRVHFDHTIFSADSFNYNFHVPGSGHFFTTVGEEVEPDINSNGIYEPEDGDNFQDDNGNGQWDPGTPYPIGIVRLDTTLTGDTELFDDANGNGQYDYGENFQDDNGNLAWDDGLQVYFDGGLGIPSPENSVPNNVYGSGQVCRFYLSGIYTATIFDIDIVEALVYQDPDLDPVELLVSSWDVYPYLVGNPHDPVLRLQQENQSEENTATISLQIGDAPKLSKFQNTIAYDPDILSYSQYEVLDYFDQLNYQITLLSNDNQGEITLEFKHNDANSDEILIIDENSFSEGSGAILEITFLVSEIDSVATISLPANNVSAESYNFSIGEPYPLDMNYWMIENSLLINF